MTGDPMNAHGLPRQGGGCSCCSISRRCFLGTMAASAAALAGCSGLNSLLKDVNPHETIDLAAFRPRPNVRIASVVLRQKPPYWLGWPGTSYPLEGERARYGKMFADMAKNVGVNLKDEPQPLESTEALEPFVRKLQAEKPDAVLVHIQHIYCWPWVAEIAKTGVPLIVFAPVGMSFTQHIDKISRKKGVYVISSLEAPAVEQALRMIRAKRQYEETRLLVVQGKEKNETKLDCLGTTVCRVPRAMMEESFVNTPENEEAKEIGRWRFRQARKVIEPTRQDGVNAARSFIAAKKLLKATGCNAITTDCLGMVTQKKVPTPPCMAASIFQDTGVTYGCEADLMGALSLMLTSYLFDRPGFMNDPVPETVKNVLIASHCVCGTRLNGFKEEQEPFILRSHSESNLGVSTQVLLRQGQPVTLVDFQSPEMLLIDTGTVVGNVNTPPAGGCRTSVEIAMDKVEDVRDVLGFHQVVFYGDHRRELEAFCQLYGIGVMHSPETTPKGKPEEKKA